MNKEALLKEYEIKFNLLMAFAKRHSELVISLITITGASYVFTTDKRDQVVVIGILNILLSLVVLYWLHDTNRHFGHVLNRLDVISKSLGIESYYKKKSWFGKTKLSILICCFIIGFWICLMLF